MQTLIKNPKKFVILLSILLSFFVLDIAVWRLDIYSNKKTIEKDTLKIAANRDTISKGVTERCRVNINKSARTTSCSVSQELIIKPTVGMTGDLSSVFEQLNELSWDANFEEFKTELLAGKSRFDNQKIRFYHDDYNPNSDLDYIDVTRDDSGISLNNTRTQLSEYDENNKGLIVLNFYRYQRSSFSHYIIGQFINF